MAYKRNLDRASSNLGFDGGGPNVSMKAPRVWLRHRPVPQVSSTVQALMIRIVRGCSCGVSIDRAALELLRVRASTWTTRRRTSDRG
jgi:hypothetical protein